MNALPGSRNIIFVHAILDRGIHVFRFRPGVSAEYPPLQSILDRGIQAEYTQYEYIINVVILTAAPIVSYFFQGV